MSPCPKRRRTNGRIVGRKLIRNRPELAGLRFQQQAAGQYTKAERALTFPGREHGGEPGPGARRRRRAAKPLRRGRSERQHSDLQWRPVCRPACAEADDAPQHGAERQGSPEPDRARRATGLSRYGYERLNLTQKLLAQAQLALTLHKAATSRPEFDCRTEPGSVPQPHFRADRHRQRQVRIPGAVERTAIPDRGFEVGDG